MKSKYVDLPVATVNVDVKQETGPFEWWRHGIGHGGINSLPLPDRVVDGARKLRPRLVRTFIQQYHDIYPAHGRFDWSRLDPYMASLAATGAKVVAAIAIKPPVLFPERNHAIWQPNDVAEWQEVIRALVRRYSVERPMVTYWEVGNEPDIGENGGSPFLIESADDYLVYYQQMAAAVREAFPAAKVGGPAIAGWQCPLFADYPARCREAGVPLDFLSWHIYSDDPAAHARTVDFARGLAAAFPAPCPELLLTEWNRNFEPVSVEEMAFESTRAANTTAIILSYMDAGLDWSFYYHVWDQTNFPGEFAPFFAEPGIMELHWNQIPHRFGLFGVGGEVRPQYFVYQMFSRMGETGIQIACEHPALRVKAARDGDAVSVLLVNHHATEAHAAIGSLKLSGLTPGRKRLTVYRIDDAKHWNAESLELLPTEQREVDTYADFACQVFCPAESVTLVTLRSAGAE